MTMDHRWDDSTLQDRAGRDERERFAASRIARDPDVERRDRLAEEERRRVVNMTPWSIGSAFYDQRDLYTRNHSFEADGYGVGPSYHPEEGSYAYHRELHPGFVVLREGDASLFEREAWPWLNYKSAHDDPYFAHLHEHEHEHGVWQRLKASATGMKARVSRALHLGDGRAEPARSDADVEVDVTSALRRRDDLDASDIEITVRQGKVTLDGTVADRREKRIAREVCESVAGVRDVHNRLKIRHDDADVSFGPPLALAGF
jgi:hypothetical protein